MSIISLAGSVSRSAIWGPTGLSFRATAFCTSSASTGIHSSLLFITSRLDYFGQSQSSLLCLRLVEHAVSCLLPGTHKEK